MIAVPLTALWIMPLLMLRRCSPHWASKGRVLWLAQFGLDGLLWLAAFAAQFESGLLTTRDWPAASLFLAGLRFGWALCWFGPLRCLPVSRWLSVAWAWLALADDHCGSGRRPARASTERPLSALVTRPGAVWSQKATGSPTEQLARFFNAKPQPCALETCLPNGRACGSPPPSRSRAICARLPEAIGVTLAAAPTRSAASEHSARFAAIARRDCAPFAPTASASQGFFAK